MLICWKAISFIAPAIHFSKYISLRMRAKKKKSTLRENYNFAMTWRARGGMRHAAGNLFIDFGIQKINKETSFSFRLTFGWLMVRRTIKVQRSRSTSFTPFGLNLRQIEFSFIASPLPPNLFPIDYDPFGMTCKFTARNQYTGSITR